MPLVFSEATYFEGNFLLLLKLKGETGLSFQ